MKLNLGCGKDIREGYVNVDYITKNTIDSFGIDVIADLSKPLPFDDNTVEGIYASHVFEHIPNWEDLLIECHRVMKCNSTIEIRVPYGVTFTAFHKRFFKEESMDGFLLDLIDMPNTGLQRFPRFHLVSRLVWRKHPFDWHIHKYLGINIPVGWKVEIRWILRKVW